VNDPPLGVGVAVGLVVGVVVGAVVGVVVGATVGVAFADAVDVGLALGVLDGAAENGDVGVGPDEPPPLQAARARTRLDVTEALRTLTSRRKMTSASKRSGLQALPSARYLPFALVERSRSVTPPAHGVRPSSFIGRNVYRGLISLRFTIVGRHPLGTPLFGGRFCAIVS
jgi:hypothetical protein